MGKEKLKLIRRSYIWSQFTEYGRDRAKCGICGKILSIRGGNTSNLRRHAAAKHKKKSSNKSGQLESDEDSKSGEKKDDGVVIVENCNGESLPNEILINEEMDTSKRNYKRTESPKRLEEEISARRKGVEVATQTHTKTVKNISTQTLKENFRLDREVNVVNNKPFIIECSKYKKVKALKEISNSLSRMATSFEFIAECFVSKMLKSNIHEHNNNGDNEQQHTLSNIDDVVHVLEVTCGNEEVPSVDENNDMNSLLNSLNLLPKSSDCNENLPNQKQTTSNSLI